MAFHVHIVLLLLWYKMIVIIKRNQRFLFKMLFHCFVLPPKNSAIDHLTGIIKKKGIHQQDSNSPLLRTHKMNIQLTLDNIICTYINVE